MAAPLFAAGSFSTGILLGVDAKGGSVGKIADDLNYELRIIKAGDPAAEVNEIPVYYAPSITVNLRYLYDRLMLQLGWEYSATFFYNEEGSVKPTAGSENKIEIEYSRFTFPLSAGLVIPAGKKTGFIWQEDLMLVLLCSKSRRAIRVRLPCSRISLKRRTASPLISGFSF
jgi:hypothetical protein